ncbi:MAG: hypothetical protein CR990_00660 [Desulfococcus sp.]|nr:MAG: hypothetical protein CR990_00660 [Desulfococcus sp.]
MSELTCNELSGFLANHRPEDLPAVWLVHGEEYLRRRAVDALLSAFLPASERITAYDPLDGDRVGEALEKVNTYSLLGGGKVVGLLDSRIFHGRESDEDLLEKAGELALAGETRKAARSLAALMGIRNMGWEDLGENPAASLEWKKDAPWLPDLIAWCRENGIKPASPSAGADLLAAAVEKGFPAGHRLLLTTGLADRRKRLYTVFRDMGAVVDCTMPRGQGKADREARNAVLRQRAGEMLGPEGKRMHPRAWHCLMEMCGDEPGVLMENLKKLMDVAAGRPEITEDDILRTLERTRKDPIFELTGAVSGRQTGPALFYLRSLLDDGSHPLQILAALTGVVRRLIMVRSFMDGPGAAKWNPRMSYSAFRSEVLPAMKSAEEEIRSVIERRLSLEDLPPDDPAGAEFSVMATASPDGKPAGRGRKSAGKARKPARKKKPVSDLCLAGSSGSPYPLYLLLKNAEFFTAERLVWLQSRITSADHYLKTGGRQPVVVLEQLVMEICSREIFREAV